MMIFMHVAVMVLLRQGFQLWRLKALMEAENDQEFIVVFSRTTRM